MAGYCAEAVKHGEEFLHPQQPLRHLTVILNPACNKRRAKKLYEQFIAPILHCAAIKISVIETENEGKILLKILSCRNKTATKHFS